MVTRQNANGLHPGSLWPEQALDLKTALEVYTRNRARAMGPGPVTGSIEVGKSADMIVIERNLFEVKPDRISKTRVIVTFFEGRVVHGEI
jgi:hypothetical protein